MEDLDLDLDNYELNDILSLFKLSHNFTKEELKSAKHIVLRTHPDKSKLPKEYFLFFSSAYKVLYSIHNFRTTGDRPKTTEYVVEEDKAKQLLLGDLSKKDNFNKVFNELFEKHHLESEGTKDGYGDWLQSNEDFDTRMATKANMGEMFEKKKKETRSLVVHRGIRELGGEGHQDLLDERPEDYSASIFSSLPYEDLRKAHQESVIPVTQEDYDLRPRFGSVNELQHSRDTDDTKPKSLQQSREYLDRRKDMEDRLDTQRAYKLAKQDETVKKLNNSWMSRFKQLKDT